MLPCVVLQQTTETLLPENPLAARRCVRRGREEQEVVLALMILFRVIMRDIFS
jgi:hypothetical protein